MTSVKGASIGIAIEDADPHRRATVGTFVGIRAGEACLVGVITGLEQQRVDRNPSGAPASLDLVGELGASFRRGSTAYPIIGDDVEIIDRDDLRAIFHVGTGPSSPIGYLHQDPSISVSLNAGDLVANHFAILGTTGVGKSSGLGVVLGEVMRADTELRILLLDGHNEYSRCFGAAANVVGHDNLRLPFWLFNFEELIDVVYGGRPPVPEEVEILAELIPASKANYSQNRSAADRLAVKRADPKNIGFTVDTPVPYILQDLLALIDDRMGRLENRASRMHYHRLTVRIETLRKDSRYAFMFENANVGGDVLSDLLEHLFQLAADGKPISVVQLAGLPVEVVDAVVCVLSRLAFDIGQWSDGAFPLLLVCEEAHRYAAADRTVGFNPARRALARIAKEGRKYRVSLGLVTQRPAELDATILSQCSTLFGMRMANEADQALLRSAVTDATGSLLEFLPSLGTREVIGFGEGMPLPARLRFRDLPAERVPHAETLGCELQSSKGAGRRELIRAAVARWRRTTMGRSLDAPEPPAEPLVSGAQRGALEQSRLGLLRRELAAHQPPPAAGHSGLAATLASRHAESDR